MRLINVRLDDDDFARVQALRRAGVELSGLIRDSIRAAHAARAARLTPARVTERADAIFRDHPDAGGDAAPRAVDPRDRKSAGEAIARRLRRRGGR